MQALQDVFDTNHDGVLNASDSTWNDFRILVTNAGRHADARNPGAGGRDLDQSNAQFL